MHHKKHPQHDESNPNAQLPPANPGGPQQNPCHDQKQAKCNYEPPPSEKRVWGMTISERIMGFLTLLAVVVAGLTARFVFNQADDMRKDQRPWVKVMVDRNTVNIEALKPVSVFLSATNFGKTPAKKALVNAAIEVVKNGERPRLELEGIHYRTDLGVVFPNEPANFPIEMSGLISQADYDDFTNRKNFLVIYGRIDYTDFFNTTHWTTFCGFDVARNPPPGSATSASAGECIQYNDVDSN